jgi:hypothetical protein
VEHTTQLSRAMPKVFDEKRQTTATASDLHMPPKKTKLPMQDAFTQTLDVAKMDVHELMQFTAGMQAEVEAEMQDEEDNTHEPGSASTPSPTTQGMLQAYPATASTLVVPVGLIPVSMLLADPYAIQVYSHLPPLSSIPAPLPPPSDSKVNHQATMGVGSKKRLAICEEYTHRVSLYASKERQRHCCFGCIAEDWKCIKSNPNIVNWQLGKIIGGFTRQYVCSICVLEKADEPMLKRCLSKKTYCKKHSVFNQQKTCTAHGIGWQLCRQCLHDPRANTRGGGFCGTNSETLAFRNRIVKGACPLPEAQVALMDQLTQANIAYAALLEETKHIADPIERKAKVEHIKTTFVFPDVSTLDSTFKLA